MYRSFFSAFYSTICIFKTNYKQHWELYMLYTNYLDRVRCLFLNGITLKWNFSLNSSRFWNTLMFSTICYIILFWKNIHLTNVYLLSNFLLMIFKLKIPLNNPKIVLNVPIGFKFIIMFLIEKTKNTFTRVYSYALCGWKYLFLNRNASSCIIKVKYSSKHLNLFFSEKTVFFFE